ncbi:MAG TPA: hypothetical protein VE174_03185, partial [Actinomycetota bacterium]|nr:hypothetical protein [Actinomycetota bacterium]
KDAHVWEDYGPGTHTWPYWERDLHKTLPRFLELFGSPPPTPSSFTHRNIESRYDIFGWAVKLKRPVLEFSRLDVKGRGTFRLSGTGRARVTTAPIYTAGEPYRVKVGRKVGTIVADPRGRLRITVALGAPNSLQAFTPGADQTSVTRSRKVTIRGT